MGIFLIIIFNRNPTLVRDEIHFKSVRSGMVNYLEIDNVDVRSGSSPYKESVKFWDDLLSTLLSYNKN